MNARSGTSRMSTPGYLGSTDRSRHGLAIGLREKHGEACYDTGATLSPFWLGLTIFV